MGTGVQPISVNRVFPSHAVRGMIESSLLWYVTQNGSLRAPVLCGNRNSTVIRQRLFMRQPGLQPAIDPELY